MRRFRVYLFKTSGATFDSVIKNEKHAFSTRPSNWSKGEIVLVSKNKVDCEFREKQIQYIMQLVDIRPLKAGEVDHYWPGAKRTWNYLIICNNTKLIRKPFNLEDLLGHEHKPYAPIMTFKKYHQCTNR
jgi:hypothetical protein